MLAVILEFEPIAGMEKEFVSAWGECTEVIYEKSSEWPEDLVHIRNKMRSLLKDGKPNILHVLELEVDLLKAQIHC